MLLRRCRANENGRVGIGIREGGSAECGSCEMKRNQYGICALNAGAFVSLSRCDASHNERYGVSSSDGGHVQAVDCQLNQNQQLGIGAWHVNSKVPSSLHPEP